MNFKEILAGKNCENEVSESYDRNHSLKVDRRDPSILVIVIMIFIENIFFTGIIYMDWLVVV